MSGLGANLRKARADAGFGLRDFARLAGVSPSFVSQIETGRSQPSVANLLAFARLLNASVDDLLDHHVEQTEP